MSAFGIDLGTTRTSVAMVTPYEPSRSFYGGTQVLALSDGVMTASAVLFDRDGEVVGEQAKRAGDRPFDCAQVFKRSMSLPEDHPSYRFSPTSRPGKSFDPVKLSAILLEHVMRQATDQVGSPAAEVVITVPAYFGEVERRRTRDAGTQAGLDVLDIINEPTAAILGYVFQPTSEQLAEPVLVFDLGGGTFDTVVVNVETDLIEVVAIRGDDRLGGRDFDNTIAQHLVDEFLDAYPDASSPTSDEVTKARLQLDIESSRELLSATSTATVTVWGFGEDARLRHSATLTREQIEEQLDSLITRCIESTREALEVARNDARDIRPERVLFVGGTSKMPAIKRRVCSEFGLEEVLAGRDHDLLVAKGAAVWAQKLSLEQRVCDDLAVASAREVDWTQTRAQTELATLAAETGHDREVLLRLLRLSLRSISSRGYGIGYLDTDEKRDRVAWQIAAQQELPFTSEPHQFEWLVDMDHWRLTVYEDTPEHPSDPDPDLARLVEAVTGDIGVTRAKGDSFYVQMHIDRSQILEVKAWHADRKNGRDKDLKVSVRPR